MHENKATFSRIIIYTKNSQTISLLLNRNSMQSKHYTCNDATLLFI